MKIKRIISLFIALSLCLSSIVAKLADDIIVGVCGRNVEIVVKKAF